MNIPPSAAVTAYPTDYRSSVSTAFASAKLECCGYSRSSGTSLRPGDCKTGCCRRLLARVSHRITEGADSASRSALAAYHVIFPRQPSVRVRGNTRLASHHKKRAIIRYSCSSGASLQFAATSIQLMYMAVRVQLSTTESANSGATAALAAYHGSLQSGRQPTTGGF